MSIINLDKNVVDAINLAHKYPTIKRIGVFGSYAKGINDTDSDIDLLYDYDGDFDKRTDEFTDYVDEIDETIRNSTSVSKIDYVWYEGVVKSNNEFFKREVLGSIVWIYSREN